MGTTALIPVFIAFTAVFALLLWGLITRTRGITIVVPETIPPPTQVKGPKPEAPPGTPVGTTDILPWSSTSPKAIRPSRSFQKVLPINVPSSTNTVELDSSLFIQADGNVAQVQPFQTVLVIPSTCPKHVTVFQDRNACTYSLTNPLTCGIMPDISYNDALRADMASINLTGPYQICFGLQNRSAHTVYQVLNASQNIQFEIPAGKTAVFFSQSNFWNTLLFRESNPTQPLSLLSTLQWKGALIPDSKGAQPLGPAMSFKDALNTAAAEIEAVQSARYQQQGGQTL